jgi:hypothetical protein
VTAIDIPATITAVAVLVASFGTLYAAIINGRKITEVHETTKSIDKAVNAKPPDAPTISEQVADIAARLPQVIEQDERG